MNAYKVYTTLDLSSKMPKFPFDFVEGAYIAMIPPLWKYVMNPYVDEIIEGKPVDKKHKNFVKYLKEGISIAVIIMATGWVYSAY